MERGGQPLGAGLVFVHGRLEADAGQEAAQVGEGHFAAGVLVGAGDGGLDRLRILVALVGPPLRIVEGLLRQQGDSVVQAAADGLGAEPAGSPEAVVGVAGVEAGRSGEVAGGLGLGN